MRKVIVLFIILVPVIAGWVAWNTTGAIRESDQAIEKQRAIIDSLRAEIRALQQEVKEIAAEIETLPEEARMARAIRSGERLGKKEHLIEGLITRARNRIKNAESRKSVAHERLVRRMVPLAALWVILVILYWRVSRRRDTVFSGGG